MKSLITFLNIFFISTLAYSEDNNLNISCQDFSWNDVEELVQPYLDETLYAALVMQAQSSNYRSSLAASQVMDNSLPKVVQRILTSLIEAEC